MKNYSETLLRELNRQLEIIHGKHDEPIKYLELAIKVLILTLEQLKTFFVAFTFESRAEEIAILVPRIVPLWYCIYMIVFDIRENKKPHKSYDLWGFRGI